MPSRTLVATAVLFFICGLGSGCATYPLQPPNEREVNEVGQLDGLPMTCNVHSDVHVGKSAILEVKITNVTQHVYDYPRFELYPDQILIIWLVRDGQQVDLTEQGKVSLQRNNTTFWDNGLMGMRKLDPGADDLLQIDLTKFFRMTNPGRYSAIIEPGLILDSTGDSHRHLQAAKTSFTILP
jgi:hypothetical protein